MPARLRGVLESPRARIAALATVLLLLYAIGLLFGRSSAAGVREAVRASGPLGAIIFVLLYAALTVLLFPGALISAAAGALFGVLIGSAVIVAGASIGSYAAFALGRKLGRSDARKLAGGQLQQIDRWVAQRGFWAVLLLRLVPLVPFNALNYAAGISAVAGRDYMLATVIGIIPGSIAFAVLGDSAAHPLSTPFVVAVTVLALLAVFAVVLRRRTR